MAITISTPVPETHFLSISDPTGETYVIIKPPDYAAESERGKMLEKRTLVPVSGFLRTQVEVNLNELWALEIWLTYVETNLVVEFTDKDGEVEKTIKFESREDIRRPEFMRRLGQLPPGLVYEWHTQVVEVVPDWAVPF